MISLISKCVFAVLQSSGVLLNKQAKRTMDFYSVSCQFRGPQGVYRCRSINTFNQLLKCTLRPFGVFFSDYHCIIDLNIDLNITFLIFKWS